MIIAKIIMIAAAVTKIITFILLNTTPKYESILMVVGINVI